MLFSVATVSCPRVTACCMNTNWKGQRSVHISTDCIAAGSELPVKPNLPPLQDSQPRMHVRTRTDSQPQVALVAVISIRATPVMCWSVNVRPAWHAALSDRHQFNGLHWGKGTVQWCASNHYNLRQCFSSGLARDPKEKSNVCPGPKLVEIRVCFSTLFFVCGNL